MGQIAIVAMQNSSPKVTECFNVESRILCMAFVSTEQPQENGEKVPENHHVPAAKASDSPSVCLGMEEGRYTWLYSVCHKSLSVGSMNVFVKVVLYRHNVLCLDPLIWNQSLALQVL